MKNDSQIPVTKLRHIYGLDFGTSNTHLSISTAGEANPIVEDIKIESNSSIPSAILYDDKNFNCIAFGQSAIEEWHCMNRQERKRHTLGTNFKQRLAFNKRAKAESDMFLSALFNNLKEQKLIRDIPLSDSSILSVGVPSRTISNHSETMIELLKSCTGKVPITIEEPLGALFYHIARKDITKEQAKGGVLVIDFGGGTLDFAYLKNFKIHAVWGSPVVGGNLFDDLFYSIFLEQNNGIEKEIKEPHMDG